MNSPAMDPRPEPAFQLQWREALSVHNDAIDRDHRWLIELVDRIQSLILRHASLARLTLALDELARYTEEHFTREEAIQRAAGYPHLGEHHRAHETLKRCLWCQGGDSNPQASRRRILSFPMAFFKVG